MLAYLFIFKIILLSSEEEVAIVPPANKPFPGKILLFSGTIFWLFRVRSRVLNLAPRQPYLIVFRWFAKAHA